MLKMIPVWLVKKNKKIKDIICYMQKSKDNAEGVKEI